MENVKTREKLDVEQVAIKLNHASSLMEGFSPEHWMDIPQSQRDFWQGFAMHLLETVDVYAKEETQTPGPEPQAPAAEPEVAAWENEGGAVETPETVEEERIEAIVMARGIPHATFAQPSMPPELLTTSDLNAFSLALDQLTKRLDEHLQSKADDRDRHPLRGRDLSDISRGVQHLQYEIAAAQTIMRATPLEHHIAETLGDHDRVDIVHRGRMLEIAKRLGEKFSISQKRPPVTRKVIGEN